MGILSVIHLRGGQRDIWWFEAFCLPFSGTKGPPKGPRGSPTVLNGQTSLPWEVEIKYSTMGWFHYGNTERYPLERWTKDIWWFEAFCLPFSDTKGPPKGPRGSPMVLNGQTSVPWEVKWNILLWADFTMGILSVTYLRGGQRNICWSVCCFQALKIPLRAPMGPQRFSMDKLVCHEKSSLPWDNFTMEILSVTHFRGGRRNIWWFEAFFAVFRLQRVP